MPDEVFRKALMVSMSNIGDTVLSLPVADTLKERMPGITIYGMCGSRSKDIFKYAKSVDKVIEYRKKDSWKEKWQLFKFLKSQGFDLIVDLRHTLWGVFFPKVRSTSLLMRIPSVHKKSQHLYKLKSTLREEFSASPCKGFDIPEDIKEEVEIHLKEKDSTRKFVLIVPGARSDTKRWNQEGFYMIAKHLLGEGFSVAVTTDKDESHIIDNQNWRSLLKQDRFISFAGTLDLGGLVYFIDSYVGCILSNDNAVVHIGSYLNIPTCAIFGPTDDLLYGPWSDNSLVIKSSIDCRPCMEALCPKGTRECMGNLSFEYVLDEFKKFLKPQ